MGKRVIRGITVSGAGTRDITIPQGVWKWWGEPETRQVEYDQKNQALRITASTAPEYTYTVGLEGKNKTKPRMSIAINRRGVTMPPGRYEAITTEIFLHKSRLDQRPEAVFARLMLVTPDFKARFRSALPTLRMLAQIVYPDSGWLECDGHQVTQSQLKTSGTTWAGLMCPVCGRKFFPTAGTVFPRTKSGLMQWTKALWLLVHKPDITERELRKHLPLVGHKVLWAMLHDLRPFLPPKPEDFDFEWTPYSNQVQATKKTFARVGIKYFNLTANAWEAMGSPPRVTILVDPVTATIQVRPDPVGPHALNLKNPFHEDTQTRRTAVQATIASIHDTMPIGIYDPVSLGRFEGIFKLRGTR